jgi:plasmid stabilization system protein ParE
VRIRWLRPAVDEAREARIYYDERKTGLGARFARELAATVRRVRELPRAWPEVDPPVRRALVNRFPYVLHYAVESDTILIVGVYHAKRRPIPWRDRLK